MKAIISETIANAVEVEKKVATCVIAPFDTGVGAIPLATVTAKGDMIAATASGAVDNLPVGASGDVLTVDSTQAMGLKWSPVEAGAGLPCNGRLTLATGTPVTTTDQTAKTTIYFTPYQGNRIALYTDSVWRVNTFTELSCSLNGLTANKNFDVFVFKDGSTLKLALTQWTNDTTRASAIAMKDGVYTNAAAMTPTAISSGIAGEIAQYAARCVGTIRTTGTTGQCEDSYLNRLVWSMDNRVKRPIKIFETTANWSYTTEAWRPWNNNTANRASFVQGLNEDTAFLHFISYCQGGSGGVGIGLDKVDGVNGVYGYIVASSNTSVDYSDFTGLGYHYLQLMEYGASGVSFYSIGGTVLKCGAVGYIMG